MTGRRSRGPAVNDDRAERAEAGERADRAGRMYRRDRVTWVAFAALFAFGVLNAVLGPVLPYLRRTEGISYLVGALHQVGFAIGGMTAGILASRSTAPRRRAIVAGLIGAAVAGLLLGYGRVLPLTLLAAVLVSGFATAAMIRVWAVLADLHRPHRAVAMAEGEIAVSLAGIATPALLSACVATALGWRFSFVIAFVLVVIAAAVVARTRLPEVSRPRSSDRGGGGDDAASARGERHTLATIFAVVGLEFTLSFWAASYLHDDVGLAAGTATVLVSVLYAANLAGRLVASRLARRLQVVTVLRICLATALVGAPILLAADNVGVAALGLAVIGTGIGGSFPLASSLHVAASGRPADQALGQILTVAGVGQISGPLVAGAVAQAVNLRLGLLVLPALVVLAAVTVRRSPPSSCLGRDAT
jgi:fucose permease